MRSDSFYTTVAQVLPTLFIAFALELLSLRRAAQEAGHLETAEEIQRRIARGDILINPGAILIALVGALVFLGETCAVLVLLTGTDTWFPIIAGPFCAICVIGVTFLALWMFWVRIVQPRT